MGVIGNNEFLTATPGIIRNAFLHSPVPVIVIEGHNLIITYANHAVLSFLGEEVDVVGRSILQTIPGLEGKAVAQQLRNVLKTGEVFEDKEVSFSVTDGQGKKKEVYFDYSCTPVAHETEGIIGVLIVMKEVTERVLAKQKLEESEQRFARLLKESPIPTVLLSGPEFKISLANTAILKLLGKTEEVIGQSLTQVLPELQKQQVLNSLEEVYRTGITYEANEEEAFLHRNGELQAYNLNFICKAIRSREDDIQEILAMGYDVSEQVATRKQADKLSEESALIRKNLEMALNSGQMGYFEMDVQSGVITATPQFNSNCGLSAEAKPDRTLLFNAMLPQYRQEMQNLLERSLQSNTNYNTRFEMVWPDGSVHWLKINSYTIYDKHNHPVKLCGIAVDITEQVKADERRAILASIIDSSDDTILSKTLEGIITSWNPAAKKMFGYEEQEAIGRHISMLIPERLLHEEDTIIGNIRQGKKIDHFETVRVTKDGREINISLSVSPIKDSSGRIIGASKIARDITEQKRNHEKQAILAAIVDSSDDTILSKTLQGIITSWNPAAQRMFGYTESEVIGKHISILIPPSHLHEEDIIIGNIARGNKVDHFETLRRAKDGRLIDISLTVSPIRDGSGKIIGASKIARDITAQKQAQRDVQNYTETLKTINKLCRTISEELDQDKLLQIITDAATSVSGADFGAFFYYKQGSDGNKMMLFTLSGALKSDFHGFDMPANTPLFHLTFTGERVIRLDDVTQGANYGKNSTHGMPKGHLPVKSYMAVPVISKTGEVTGGLLLGHKDAAKFTAQHENVVMAIAAQAAVAFDNAKLFEEVKVLNTKKDEFIGLASHELKTPLTSLSGYLQILKRGLTDDKLNSFIQKTIMQAGKLSSLVNDMLDVSKIEAGKLQFNYETFDLCKLLAETIELVQLSASTHHITLAPCDKVIWIRGDRHRIEQLIINLLTNAIKYSPKADKVTVVVEEDQEQVRFGVKDFGIGIAEDKIPHLFSRFYRVEGLNPGMSGLGIGLYLSKEIVERHHGRIWVETEEGKGSIFWVELSVYK